MFGSICIVVLTCYRPGIYKNIEHYDCVVNVNKLVKAYAGVDTGCLKNDLLIPGLDCARTSAVEFALKVNKECKK